MTHATEKHTPYAQIKRNSLPKGSLQALSYQGEGEYWYSHGKNKPYRGFWISPLGEIFELVTATGDNNHGK